MRAFYMHCFLLDCVCRNVCRVHGGYANIQRLLKMYSTADYLLLHSFRRTGMIKLNQIKHIRSEDIVN